MPEHCAACGYSLSGLGTPGSCPECGLPYDDQTLVMIGMPRRGSTLTPMRRFLWGVVIAVGVLWMNCIGFITIEPMIFMIAGVGWLIGLIALLATGKRERSATQPIIFTAGGFGLASDADTDAGRTLQPWSDVNLFRFERVGANWYRIKLLWSDAPDSDHGRIKSRSVKFEAGVRCGDEDADRVRATLTHHLRQQSETPPYRFKSAKPRPDRR